MAHRPSEEPESLSVYDALLQHEHVWSVKDIGLNAISGIINDPAAQGKSQKPLKGMDSIPPVPPTIIKKVRVSEFDPYIKTLSEVFDKYQYNRAMGLQAAMEGAPTLSNLEDVESDSLINLFDVTTKILTSQEENLKKHHQLSSSQRARMISIHAPPLDTVPSVFFDPNFKLGNPNTFEQVCEKADFSKLTADDVTLTSNLLQNKLNIFLDTVDVHLVKEISRRASSFFSALSTLQNLHQETEECVNQIHALRGNLANLSKVSVKQGLEVGRLHTRRDNMHKLYEGVKRIGVIHQTQPMMQALLSQGDYIAALDLIEETTADLKGLNTAAAAEDTVASATKTSPTKPGQADPTGGLDLRGVNAIVHLNSQLTDISKSIATKMENELINVLLGDIRALVDSIDSVSKMAPRIDNSTASTFIKNIVKCKVAPPTPPPLALATPMQTSLPAMPETLTDDILVPRLIPIIFGLLRMNRLGVALHQYKEALTKEMKVITRKYYPHVDDHHDDGSISPKKEQQSIVAKQLKSMTFDGFFDLIISVFSTLLHIIQRTSTLHEVVKNIINDAQEKGIVIGRNMIMRNKDSEPGKESSNEPRPLGEEEDDDLGSMELGSAADELSTTKKRPDISTVLHELTMDYDESIKETLTPTRGPQAFAQMVSESADVLLAVSELSNARTSKLIGVRSEQNSQLNPKDFYRLFGATREFIQGSEGVSGHHCIGLKGTMQSQAKAYLSHFHDERSKQIAVLVENDQWVKAEVPVDFQRIAEQLSESQKATSPGSASTNGFDDEDEIGRDSMHEGDDDEGDLSAMLGQSPVKSEPTRKKSIGSNNVLHNAATKSSRYLVVDGKKYYVAGCVLLFTKMLVEYIQCVENIPSLATDVLNRVLEILKLFNSRVCQCILGAGATKSAGLKNINAGHIALAAQSLGVVVATIPHLKSSMERHLPQKQHVLLADFDRLLRDYKDHQGELYLKLVSIMEERLIVQCKNLMAVNWDTPDAKDFTADNSSTVHMASLVKETSTLHRVLMKYLDTDTLRYVMTEVFKTYTKKLEDDFKKIDLFTSAGKNSSLSTLEGIDGPGNYLEVVVNNVKIKDRRTYTATSTAHSSGPSTTAGGASAMKSATSGVSGNISSRTNTPPPQSLGRATVAANQTTPSANTTPRSGMGSLFGSSSTPPAATTATNSATPSQNPPPPSVATTAKKSNFSFSWKSTE
ncbi:hypothetical protein HDV05_003609 [Chytridiales sp. JEL 0842]|nr:hypothetical protein HDV05_003609 [Chytridiales sp. JEL 0842]